MKESQVKKEGGIKKKGSVPKKSPPIKKAWKMMVDEIVQGFQAIIFVFIVEILIRITRILIYICLIVIHGVSIPIYFIHNGFERVCQKIRKATKKEAAGKKSEDVMEKKTAYKNLFAIFSKHDDSNQKVELAMQ